MTKVFPTVFGAVFGGISGHIRIWLLAGGLWRDHDYWQDAALWKDGV